MVYEKPRFSSILQCFIVSFTMSSQRKGGEERKRTNLSIGAKLELIKKLESGVSVSRVCEEWETIKVGFFLQACHS